MKKKFSKMEIWKRHIEDVKDSTGKKITLKEAKKQISPIEMKEVKEQFETIQWEKKMKKK